MHQSKFKKFSSWSDFERVGKDGIGGVFSRRDMHSQLGERRTEEESDRAGHQGDRRGVLRGRRGQRPFGGEAEVEAMVKRQGI